MVLIAAIAMLRPLFGRSDAGSDPNRMVVLPFVVRGPQSLHYLEDGLPILLGTRLDGAGSLRTVDPRALIVHLAGDKKGTTLDADRAAQVAARFGAQLYVLGSIVATGDKLRFSASLYDRAHGSDPIAHTEVDGTEAELVHHVDKLASELLAARFRVAGGTIAETAARTTTSLPALKSWLTGEAAITAGRYAEAIGPLREAIAADSDFAMAHFRLAVAANWSGMPRLVDAEARRAVALSDRMSPSTRLVLQAFLDMRSGNYAHAARALRTVLDEQPSATEAWYEMGEVLFHGNPPQGRPLSAARDAFETALRLDPHNFSAAIHLARIAASSGDTAALDRLSKASLDSNPDPAQRSEIFLLRALALRDPTARSRFLAQPPTIELLDALWRDTEYSGNLVTASAIADSLVRVAPTAEMRASLHVFLAHVAMGRERFDEATRHIDSIAIHAPQSAAVTRLLLASHPAYPAASRAALLDRALAAATPLPAGSLTRHIYLGSNYPDSVSSLSAYAVAQAHLVRGDSTPARALLGAIPAGIAIRMLQARMQLTLATDHPSREAALRSAETVDSLCGAIFTSQSAFAPRALYHFAVARALEDEGRVAEAHKRLQALPEDFGFNVAYASELHRRRAALLDKLGRQVEAVASRRAMAEGVK
jgi:tetratricopeptide (TPR) repeat protein